MSADLFAEFNDLSNNSASDPASAAVGQSNPPKARAQPQAWSQDLLGFSQDNSGSNNHSQGASLNQWPAVQHGPGPSVDWASSTQAARLSAAAVQGATGDDDDDDDNDGWGDFETAEPAVKSSVLAAGPSAGQISNISWGSLGGPTTSPQVPSFHQSHNAAPPASNLPEQPWHRDQSKRTTFSHPSLKDPNVLFDADDFELQDDGDAVDEDGDDFGDFAAATRISSRAQPPAAATKDPVPSIDLLALEHVPQPVHSASLHTLAPPKGALSFGASSSCHKPWSTASEPRDRDFHSLGSLTHSESNRSKADTSHVPAPFAGTSDLKVGADNVQKDGDDGWGAWDDIPSGNQVTISASTELKTQDTWDWDDQDSNKPLPEKFNSDAPPPINVPPPSIIMSIFPDLFSLGSSPLKSITGQSAPVKRKILSDPKTARFLQGFICLGTTAARVVAGRKQRWHRDKMLAKSMSISAAGSKGMKLVGVDKSQSAREDREASDVVACWREHVGRLRGAVAAANSSSGFNLKVPELSENMQIHAAKLVPTARSPCIICGLKREERVAKVDFDVEDSFGEWWIEHWGHRSCKNFWHEHEEKLRQR
ncbi:hypothetical protein HIM_01704 [Hirsutella minnesotensis 3608]|nr:hypothetical protein HIM_01704 [Hirsutella minnesotensis 3608]